MTPTELKNTLVSQIDSVVEHLLPNGVRAGQEWCVGSIAGEQGKSLKVRLQGGKAGMWQDFANPEHKGDLLDLWSAVRGIPFVDVLKEVKDYAGIIETKPDFWPKKQIKKPEKPQCTSPKASLNDWALERSILPETLKAFKVGQKNNAAVFPFISPSGELELVKYREVRTKKIWSNKSPIPCLFGWQAITDDDRIVVICEGEFDAMAWHQAGAPALSVPFGGGTGEKQGAWIDYEYHRLERFEHIYLSMDMDTAGNQALNTIADRLGRHRCKVVTLPFKDANECILQPDGSQILKSAIESARTIDPDELKSLSEFHSEIVDEIYPPDGITPGMELPWVKAHGEVLLRQSETTLWAGNNGGGKTVALSNIAVDGMAQGEKFCIASMEMKPRKIGKQIYRQLGGKAGAPYILHPLRVMFSMADDAERIVAVLHDVVEDSDTTLDDLRAEGFPEEIVLAVDSVTRRKGESYGEFTDRAGRNLIGTKVKIADLEDNMDIGRISNPTAKDYRRVERYAATWVKLSNLVLARIKGGDE